METEETRAAWSSFVLLEDFRGGDDTAAEALFARYFERLTLLARSRLSPRLASRTDPEDVVLSVYRSFFAGVRAGRFALQRGGDLWRLLASITMHKLLRQARYHAASRRAVGVELPIQHAEERGLLGHHREASVEDAAALADELEWVFLQLNAFERRALELRLQGAPLSEIAEETGRSERTVRRILGQIRGLVAGRLDNA